MLTACNSSMANTAHPRGQENKDAEKQQHWCSRAVIFVSQIIFPLKELYLHEVDLTRQSQGVSGWRAGLPPAKVQFYFLTSPLTNCHNTFITPVYHELHQAQKSRCVLRAAVPQAEDKWLLFMQHLQGIVQ